MKATELANCAALSWSSFRVCRRLICREGGGEEGRERGREGGKEGGNQRRGRKGEKRKRERVEG